MLDPKLIEDLRKFFDAEWYLARNPDVRSAGVDPLLHYVNFGANEGRDPNRYFDGNWYMRQNRDVAEAGLNPLLHYLQFGAAEHRSPHPRFNVAWYVEQHPEASANPLLYHILFGAAQGWPTERVVAIADYLPSEVTPPACPEGLAVDVIIPVYRGLAETQRAIGSVLDDPHCLPGRVIVIDDCSPERKLSRWLEQLAAKGRILLIRNVENQGFVASINHGIAAAERHDVVLLNSDTEVPPGWLRRLAAHAYAAADIASVSPFSNNATICSYPGPEGGPMPFGKPLAELDAACREANAGRSVAVPTAVGFCMFIRRAALDQVGAFDTETFGRGYGEENDFCLRASARGWRHLLACDTFVYHQGKVSFGAQSACETRSEALLTKRYPDYQRIIRRHVRLNPAAGARFALTAALFRDSGRPCILMVSHDLGGGVQRHIEEITRTVGERANFMLLQSTANGVALSAPTMPGHPTLPLAGHRIDDLARFLRSAGVTRLHIHHLMGMELDLRRLIHELGVPFDFTVHDYFTICPQVNLLPQFDQHYCGEPGPAGCNACIAERRAPESLDILAWRLKHAWSLTEAVRVFCPSEDVRRRLARYRLDRRAMVVPHEPVTTRSWTLRPTSLGRSKRLRVGLIGVLADQKGARTAAAVAEAADPRTFEFRLIGYVERPLPSPAAERIQQTGEYDDADLPQLLAGAKLNIAWFPAQWPETYSYTLSAAMEAGLPIIASDIGAFTERLAGRPLTWLVDPAAPASVWLGAFARARAVLAEAPRAARGKPRLPTPDFYATAYLNPARQTQLRPRGGRRASRVTVVVIPERLETGQISPCAYIRLLLPLAHPAIGADLDVIQAEPDDALRYRPDIIATHRHAIPDIEIADRLRAHCDANRITLLYDLDDDLTHIPPSHPEASTLGARAPLVVRLLRHADAVSVSTPALRARLARLCRTVLVVPNGLDEQLWSHYYPAPRWHPGGMNIVFMGTATHGPDLAIVLPAIERLLAEFGRRVRVDIVGVTSEGDLPEWVNRVTVPASGASSYPGFVDWFTRQADWDVGIAPLEDTPFNRCKSAIKTMDYAALGLAVVASDVPAFRGSIADGPGGFLAPNTPMDWYEALSRMLRNPRLRQTLGEGARTVWLAQHTLGAQAVKRRRMWQSLARARFMAAE